MSVFFPLCPGASYQGTVFSILPEEGMVLSAFRISAADPAAPNLPTTTKEEERVRGGNS